jgi:hypothetical protein
MKIGWKLTTFQAVIIYLRNIWNFWTGYTSITCSKLSNIPYNLIFTTQFNDSSILIKIIPCDYLNLSLANEYVDDVTIPTQVIQYNQIFHRRISQSDFSFQIKLNYLVVS